MTSPMEAEARRKHDRSHITDEERRAIDAALQAGRVQRIPCGKSSLWGEMRWCHIANQIVEVEPHNRKWNGKGNHRNERNAKRRDKNMETAKQLHQQGKTPEQIAQDLGVSLYAARKYLRDSGCKVVGVKEQLEAELAARVKTARQMWKCGKGPDLPRLERRPLLEKIAAKLGVSIHTVRDYINDPQIGVRK